MEIFKGTGKVLSDHSIETTQDQRSTVNLRSSKKFDPGNPKALTTFSLPTIFKYTNRLAPYPR